MFRKRPLVVLNAILVTMFGALGFEGAAAAQSLALKIVVIAGEGSVNIIEQKTAVAPVVEVRDRNDQPVAGALVLFIVRGGRGATFAGNPTLRLVTDEAGRAAATGLTPTSAGPLTIDVSATYQGRGAKTTISQSNFATAAQAAGASAGAAGVSAASAGGGGGLSATTITLIGGAAVGGAAVYAIQENRKPSAGPTPSPLIGTWVLLSTTNTGPIATAAIGVRRKTFTETTWEILEIDPATGNVRFNFGGSYTLLDGVYTETVEFSNVGASGNVGMTFSFTLTLDGSTFTQTGQGNPFTETWGKS